MITGRKSSLGAKYPSLVLIAILLTLSIFGYGQTYNPTTATVSNKPYGSAQAFPTDARSYFFDGTNFLWRPYQSVAEVKSYLNLAKYRTGQFIIVVDSGGSLQSNGTYIGGVNTFWMFRTGTTDGDLTELSLFGTSGTCAGCLLAANNLSDVSSIPGARTTLLINNVDNTSDASKNSASVSLTNHTIDANNNTLLHIPNSALTNNSIGLTATSNAGSDISVTTTPAALGTSLIINFPSAGTGTRGPLTATDWNTFNNKQSPITLTVVGTSGPATLAGSVLNIPQYTAGTGCTNCNADSLKHLPVDTSANRNGYILAFDSTNHKWYLTPNAGSGAGITQLTGDGTAGPGSGSQVFTLATVNSNVGTFGSASTVPQITLNGKGLSTAASSVAIQIAESQVTNLITDLAAKQTTTLTSGNILVGNGSNIATSVTPSGDWTINNTGVNVIGANKITYAKFQASSQQALLGATGAGNFGEITLGTNLSMTGSVLNANGGVNSVSNSDGTLTISPTTGAVVASLALGHANTWSALQTFGTLTTTGVTKFTGIASGASTDSILRINPSTGQVTWSSGIPFTLFAVQGLKAYGTSGDSVGLGGSFFQADTIATNGFSFLMTGLPNKTYGSTDSSLIEDINGKFFKVALPSLTTTGTSGAATFSPATGILNIPQYQASGSYITSLTTDVVATGPGAAVATIQPNVVTYAKIQTAAGAGLMGATGASNFGLITLGTNLAFSGSVLNATNGVVNTQLSITGDGSTGNKIRFVNDSTPGNDYYYGSSYIGRLQYSLPNVNWKNAIKLGADPTGAVDATSIIQTAINSGFSIYFPNGTYQIKELKLKDSSRLMGESTTRTIFKMTTADTSISMGNYCEVDHIYFKGNRTSGQIGINVDSVLGCNVHDIRGDSMGTVILTTRAARIPGNLFPYGNRFSSIQGRSNKMGMNFGIRGEYSNVSDVNFNQCDTGLMNISGNNSFVNYSATLGGVGMYEGSDAQNDGHATCTNCKFNHNTYPLIVQNSSQGYTFNGCDFYFGKMQINNSSLIEFIGCDLKTDSLTFNTVNAISFVGCKILSSPFLVGQTGSNNVTTLNCNDSHGVDFYDILGAKHFYILNSGGSTTISNNLDKSMQTTWNGSLHMEYNTSAVTDPFQFYISASTGSSFAILNYHLSPLYALRVDNAGNTAIHLTSPTAFLHIAGGTATAGTAPLKITGGTLLTTTEAGAIENNGTHLFYTAANGGTRFQLDQQSGSGVTTVGTFSGSSQTNGASISSSTITFGPADRTNPGMVSIGAQTIAGAKTFTGNMDIGGSSVPATQRFTIEGNTTYAAASGNGGIQLNTVFGSTNTDATTTGTSSFNMNSYSFQPQTLAAANSGVTYTTANTVYINGPPTAGTNVTITNPYALRIGSGNSYFNGSIFGANNSDINFSHFIGNSSTPGIAGGSGAGTGPTVSITGTDQSGVISVTTGTTPSASAAIATITYNYAYPNNTFPTLTPANAATALLSGVSMVFTTGSTTNFILTAGTTALTTLTTYSWYYNIGSK